MNNNREFILAIDPGNKESAYVLLDRETLKPLAFNKLENGELLESIIPKPFWEEILQVLFTYTKPQDIVYPCVEMVASYGMAVGKDVFDTVAWIGWFVAQIQEYHECYVKDPRFIYRMEEKMNLCHMATAKDANITQALVDRFAPGEPNHGKGTKKNPGWFYGFRKDVWAAYAVGVTYHDRYLGEKLNE